MTITTVHVTSDFSKAFKKLPKNVQKLSEMKDLIFRNDPYQDLLRTHALRGELSGYHSYSVSFRYRVLFRFIDQRTVVYYDIGTHEIYRRG